MRPIRTSIIAIAASAVLLTGCSQEDPAPKPGAAPSSTATPDVVKGKPVGNGGDADTKGGTGQEANTDGNGDTATSPSNDPKPEKYANLDTPVPQAKVKADKSGVELCDPKTQKPFTGDITKVFKAADLMAAYCQMVELTASATHSDERWNANGNVPATQFAGVRDQLEGSRLDAHDALVKRVANGTATKKDRDDLSALVPFGILKGTGFTLVAPGFHETRFTPADVWTPNGNTDELAIRFKMATKIVVKEDGSKEEKAAKVTRDLTYTLIPSGGGTHKWLIKNYDSRLSVDGTYDLDIIEAFKNKGK